MDSRWFSGLNAEEKEERKKLIKSFKQAFDELNKILDTPEEPPLDFGPSWSEEAAFYFGQRAYKEKVLRLLNVQ